MKEPDNNFQVELACDPPNTQLPESVPDLSDKQLCTRKHKVCTHWTLLNIPFVHYFTSLICLPAVSQRAEADTEDGSVDTDGTADVLVGHRPRRLAQPSSLLLGLKLIFGHQN